MKEADRANRRPASFLYHALWQALDVLFPPTCPGCQQIGVRWCETCQGQIQRVTAPLCPRCGEPQTAVQTCQKCLQQVPAFEQLRSFAFFEGPLREAMHQLKYQNNVGVGEALSKHLIALYNELEWEIDLVSAVPLSKARLQERGYNQSGLLAKPFAYAIQKLYQPNAIQRMRETRSQVGLSIQERHTNVQDAFWGNTQLVKGKTILIIDDVTTTGATINACAQALAGAGAAAVYGLTLARAGLHTHTAAPPDRTA